MLSTGALFLFRPVAIFFKKAIFHLAPFIFEL